MRQVAFVLWATVSALPVVAQTVDTRDLTIMQPSTNAAPPAVPGGRPSHQPVEQAPLVVTLHDFDRQTYEMYEKMTYRVVVRNSGRTSFDVPLERDWGRLIDDTSSPLISCVVSLEVVDKQRKHYALTSVTIYGSRGNPQTVMTLRPGEAVELIVPGKWEFDSDLAAKPIVDGLPLTLNVVANVGFLHQPRGHWYASAASTNEITVELTSARTR